jgi:transposase-like protein
MARGRTHSREFKLEVVHQVVSGAKRPAQVCREHGLANSVLDRWRQEYAARGEAAFTPRESEGEEAWARRIAELERFCGQLALENAALKKGLASMTSRTGTR